MINTGSLRRRHTLNTFWALLLLVFLFGSCQRTDRPDYPTTQNVAADSTFGAGQKTGRIQFKEMDEISGLAVSKKNEGLIWAHNDSGDRARLFLIRPTGELVATYTLPEARNIDWEDMAIGPGPDSTQTYLYIADIGNNRLDRTTLTIYRAPEPSADTYQLAASHTLRQVEVITFRYPDGRYNAETLLLDPVSRDLFILTKNENPERLYRLPFPQTTSQTVDAGFVGNTSFSGALGGSLSADRQLLFIKTQKQVLIWHLTQNQTPEVLTDTMPSALLYHEEPQGEALAITPDGSAYYTISEAAGHSMPFIFRYPRQKHEER